MADFTHMRSTMNSLRIGKEGRKKVRPQSSAVFEFDVDDEIAVKATSAGTAAAATEPSRANASKRKKEKRTGKAGAGAGSGAPPHARVELAGYGFGDDHDGFAEAEASDGAVGVDVAAGVDHLPVELRVAAATAVSSARSDTARPGTVYAGFGSDDDDDAQSMASTSSRSSRLAERVDAVGAMHPDCGTVGLKNLGNTCFMNSIVQCLSFTVPLTSYVLEEKHEQDACKKSPMKGMLVKEFGKLLSALWKQDSPGAISPKAFKTQIGRFAPRFVGYAQQDSQEFLRFLLDGLHEDLNRVQEKPPYPKEDPAIAKLPLKKQARFYKEQYTKRFASPILDIFSGQLRSSLKCTKCGHVSNTWDQFCDLSLSVPDIDGDGNGGGGGGGAGGSYAYSNRQSARSSGAVTIQQCFDKYVEAEVLDGDEMPTCEKCKARRKCTKSLRIESLPPVLVLHIKRFSFMSRGAKITKNVDFPTENLTLKDYCTETSDSLAASYSLYAVSNHMGSLRGGHYTAYCRHPTKKRWFEFNDQHVQAVQESTVGGPEAYVLFYKRDGTGT